MKYIRVLQVVCVTASALGDTAPAPRVEKSDFMKTILSKGHRKLALVVQPSITKIANELLQSFDDHSTENSREEAHKVSIEEETQEYIGPLRRIPKKNWKKRPGGLKSTTPVPKADCNKPWFYEWDYNGQYIGDDGAKGLLSPIEILIDLSHCLNQAASSSISPSNRYIDLNTLYEPQSWINPTRASNERAAKRFNINGEYRLIGSAIGIPDDPKTWNIFSKHAYSERHKRSAIGMCVNVNTNQGFSVLAQRYTDQGRVKKASALSKELEEKCKKYPYTFLASTFIPG